MTVVFLPLQMDKLWMQKSSQNFLFTTVLLLPGMIQISSGHLNHLAKNYLTMFSTTFSNKTERQSHLPDQRCTKFKGLEPHDRYHC